MFITPIRKSVPSTRGQVSPALAHAEPGSVQTGPNESSAGARPLLDLVRTSLDDDQAIDPVVIDLEGKSSIADAMVVASGRSARHVVSMADHLIEKLKAAAVPARIEGKTVGDWVLIDAGDVIVHLFRPEVRTFYNIEKMWNGDAPPADRQPGQRLIADEPAGFETGTFETATFETATFGTGGVEDDGFADDGVEADGTDDPDEGSRPH